MGVIPSKEEVSRVTEQAFDEVREACQDDRITGAWVLVYQHDGLVLANRVAKPAYAVSVGHFHPGYTSKYRELAVENADWMGANGGTRSSVESRDTGFNKLAGAIRATGYVVSSTCFKPHASEALSLLVAERLGWLTTEDAVEIAMESCNSTYLATFTPTDCNKLKLCKRCHLRLVSNGDICEHCQPK